MAQTKICSNCNKEVPLHIPKCPYCRTILIGNKTMAPQGSPVATKNAKLNSLLHGEKQPNEPFSPAENSEPSGPISPIVNTDADTVSDSKFQSEVSVQKEASQPENPITYDTPNQTINKQASASVNTREDSKKEKPSFFGKHKSDKKISPSSQNEESAAEEDEYDEPEEVFDANSDGYYDDVVPELAEQINRLPTENIIRLVFTGILIAAVLIIAFAKI